MARRGASRQPTTDPRIKTFCSPHPRRNLPSGSSRRQAESKFTRSFQRSFLDAEQGQGIGGHEFELHGYGIADFVWASVPGNGKPNGGRNGVRRAAPLSSTKAKLTAFEMKLKDWPRALQQAYRYTYFSDRTIVVLPTKSARAAKDALPLFEELRIGLWGYEKKAGRITKLFTPRARRPKNPAARERALSKLNRKFDLSRSREKA